LINYKYIYLFRPLELELLLRELELPRVELLLELLEVGRLLEPLELDDDDLLEVARLEDLLELDADLLAELAFEVEALRVVVLFFAVALDLATPDPLLCVPRSFFDVLPTDVDL